MGVLTHLAIVAVALGGCYAPDLRDCTVTCSAATDCADGQRCLGGLCVADGETKTCSQNLDSPDAAPAQTTQLHLTIQGHGHIVIGDATACDSAASDRGDCTVTVPRQVTVHAQAVAAQDATFMTWTASPCDPHVATCDFTPSTPMLTLSAKFK